MKRRQLFPGAVSVAGAALITEGDGVTVLYLATYGRGAPVGIHRVPDQCMIMVETFHPLLSARHWRGAEVVFQTVQARQVLNINTIRLCRVLLKTLDTYAQQFRLDQAMLMAAQHKPGAA